jgi:hypothetical protein
MTRQAGRLLQPAKSAGFAMTYRVAFWFAMTYRVAFRIEERLSDGILALTFRNE